MAAKLALVSAAFLLLFSGLALAGTLPGPLQGFASHEAARIGVHLPRPNGPADTPAVKDVASPGATLRHTAQPSRSPKPSKTNGQAQAGSQGQSNGQNSSPGQATGQQQAPSQGDDQQTPPADQSDQQTPPAEQSDQQTPSPDPTAPGD